MNAFLQISSMCIQDPFVLDHNTASNVNEKQSIYICSQFQLAASRCRLTDFTSFGGGADTSCQSPGLLLLMSSAPSIIEAPANNNEAVKQTSTGPVVQSVSVTFSLSKLATDSSCRQAGDLDAVRDAWCRDVASITRATLIEIMGMTCITRDCPSSTLLSHVTGGRSEAATQDCRVDRVKKQSESRDVQDVGVGKTTGVVNKRVLSYDSTTDGRVNVTGDETAVKRHKADDCLVGSDASELNPMRNYGDDVESQYVNDEQTVTSCESSNNISVVDDHKPLNIACDSQLLCADGMSQCCSAGSRNSGEHLPDVEYLFAADCSASCRLWSGRKKVRQQLTHYAHEYLREVEVTKMLKSKMPEPASSTQLPILTFEIVVVRRPVVAIDTVTIAMCPTRNTFAEFSCFVMYFKSLLVKLIERCVTGASCVR